MSSLKSDKAEEMAENGHEGKIWKKDIIKDKVVESPYPVVDVPCISFPDYIYKYLHKHGDKTFMINADTSKEYSYKMTAELSTRVASAFIRMGLQHGEVICIYSSNKPEYAIAWLAAASVGLVVTLCNPSFTIDELVFQLKDTDSVLLLCGSENVENAIEAAKEVPSIRKVIVFGDEEGNCIPFTQLLSDDGSLFKKTAVVEPKEQLLAMPYSSGTTGLPKGVMHTHFTIIASLCQLSTKYLRFFTEDDVYPLILPLFHIYGTLALWHSATIGATAIVMSKFKPDVFLSSIPKYKISSLTVVPPLVHFLLQHPMVEKFDLSSVKTILCGAAPLSKEQESAINKKFNTKLRQGYGMTEFIPMSIGPLDFPRATSIGVPLPDTKMKVVNIETNESNGPNEIGEIWGWSPNRIMKGYLKNPEATAMTIDKDGWLHCGDLGYYDEDGYFYVVDRLKELIKFKGHQVAPAELEALLITHPSLKEAAVIGVPDEIAGELPRAYVVLNPGHEVTEKEVQEFVAGKTSPEKHLRGGVIFIEEIPKSASGKILRKNLKKNL